MKEKDLRLRRLARYSASEQALAESFQHCETQQLPQELHLEALKRATFILDVLAADARDAGDRLRVLLANRSAEPTLYRSMQCQRWMAERRHVALDQLSKTLRTELARLSSSTNFGQTLTLESSNSKPNTNLVKFFESSWRRIPIRSRTRRRMPLPSKPRDEQLVDDFYMEFPRRHNENHIIPLVLKSPQQRHFFPSYTPQPPQNHSASASSVENATSTPSPSADSNLETIIEDNETTPHSTLPVDYNQGETDGTALIWRDAPFSKEKFSGELHVPMPDYVIDLLAGFESNSHAGPITLASHTRFKLDTSPPTTLRKPIQKSPSRHKLSTIFSAIPETLTSRLINTNGNETTKASQVGLGMQPIDSVTQGSSRPFAMAFSEFNPSNSSSQAPDTQEKKMIVRIRRRISILGRI